METLISLIQYDDTHHPCHVMALSLLTFLKIFAHRLPVYTKIGEIFTAFSLFVYNLATLEVTFSIIESCLFTSLVSDIFIQPHFWASGFLSGVYFVTIVPITLILLWRSLIK